MLTAVVIVLAMLIGGAVVGVAVRYMWQEHERARQQTASDFREALVSRLRKQGPRALRLARLAQEHGIPEKVAREVPADLYAEYCRQAVAEGRETDAERDQ